MMNIIYNSKRIIKIGFLVVFPFLLLACADKKQEENTDEENENSTEVSLTKEQYKTVGIKTGFIEKRNLKTIIKANGYTTVPPQNSANVATLIGGVVKDIYVLEGTFVKKGTLLARLQNLEVVEMQEDYKSAIANIEYLQLEYNRQKTLSEENINPRKVFQEVKAKLAAEKARAQAAKTKLEAINVNPNGNSSLIPIITPISGYVSKIGISKGAFADTGVTLFEVVDNSQMHLDLNVYEKDLGKIAIGQEVDFILTNQSNKSIKGKIFGINKSFSNESKTVAVHAKINPDDAKDLISGMYVSANIDIDASSVSALPKNAVIKNGDKYFIFVEEEAHSEKPSEEIEDKTEKHEENDEVHFQAIEVIPGTTDMGYTEINFITSIPENSSIVIEGTFYVLSALKGGGEHTH